MADAQDLRSRISEATKDAMRQKDAVRLSTLRLISAAIKDRDIEARAQDRCEGIGEGDILSLLAKMVKQREESASTYEQNGRVALADREREEITTLREFMPEPLTAAEVESIIEERVNAMDSPCLKDMGKIMGELKRDYSDRIDMGKAGGVVKRYLCAAKE